MAREVDVLIAACGLYCGACYHYRASFYDSDRLFEDAARQGREPNGFTCQGCRSEILYIYPGCAQCEIRACADGKGILNCGLCMEFPCDRIEAFQDDGRVHHRDILIELADLREKGADKWLVEQAQRWRCECGESYSWYEQICCNCGKPLDSYGADLRVGCVLR
jgi:hypothetical protein